MDTVSTSDRLITGIPVIDIILNIESFTANFEDRNKILLIIKELYNRCNNMKKLLMKHHALILKNLLEKYDKKCILYNYKPPNKKDKEPNV